jgi:hypothetical protein
MRSIRFQVLALVAYQTAIALDVQTSIETNDLFDTIEQTPDAIEQIPDDTPSDAMTPADDVNL